MSLERLHKTIKYYYLDAKSVSRLDKFLHNLFEFIRDRIFERIIMKNKGRVSYKLRELRKRHKSVSDEIKVTAEDANHFIISSKYEVYYVSRNIENCECKLVCYYCRTCIHQFVCTCIDSSIKWNMCKHIHAVCQHIINDDENTILLPLSTLDEDNVASSFTDQVLSTPKSSLENQATLLAVQENNTGPTNDELSQIHSEVLEILKSVKG